ncbi:MAG: hypothetical protein IJ068_02300 [Bacilli bacterium]|nr:hypothetical protein [Bacilli bacterium]
MIKFIEATVVNNNYNDNWSITFYFVALAAITISLIWTILKMNKQEKKNNNQYKENTIYNKSEDLIENMDVFPKRKIKERIENYYDVYQNQNRQKSSGVEENPIDDYTEYDINDKLEEDIDIKQNIEEKIEDDVDISKEEINEDEKVVESVKEKNTTPKNTNKNSNNKNRSNNKKKGKNKKKK